MAKLDRLLTLERMMAAYDTMNIEDAWITGCQATCIEHLVDDIIALLSRLLNSKTRLSSRNVLVANFDTMTNPVHWLRCKIFTDLPEAISRVLKEKFEQMVELMKELMVKIVNVEASFADRFFEKLMQRCKKYKTTDYDLWKIRQDKLTINELVRYEVDLTAKMLKNGVLKYADEPNGEELQGVNEDMLKLKMTDSSMITPEFIAECAKLRRYSYWDGCMFMIDYQLFRSYMFRNFGRLTSEQHIDLFNYDVQMQQIHEDMKRLTAGQQGESNIRKLARAIENCQAYFWGSSAYAVAYCIYRDDFKEEISKSAFEQLIEQQTYEKQRTYKCSKGSISNAFSDNPIFSEHIDDWDDFDPMPRIIKLRDAIRNELK